MNTDFKVESDALLTPSGINGNLQCEEKIPTKSFLQKIKDHTYRFKFLQSLCMSFAFWSLGFQSAQRGASFLDIQLITGTDVETASTFLTAGSVGILSGSLISGIFYDKFNKDLLLGISVICLAVTVTLLPLCSHYGLMLFIFWANSFFMGWLATGVSASLMSVWGDEEGRPYMQAVNFAFAFGGAISPLVTDPFLAPKPQDRPRNDSSTFVVMPQTNDLNAAYVSVYNSSINSTSLGNSTHDVATIETKLFYAYMISGIIAGLSALPFIIMYCRSISRERRGLQKKEENKPPKRDLPLVYYILAIILLNVMFMMYCAVEGTFYSYLLTFVVLHLKWSKTRGSLITSAFWASFAVSRFFGIFAIGCIKPVFMLLICMTSLIISLLGLLISSYLFVDQGVWVFTIWAGLSMSVIFPTCFTWAQENLFKITGKITSSIFVSGSVGAMINPIILGYLFQEISPMWYSYLLVGESIVFLFIFLFLLYVSTFILVKVRIVEGKCEEIHT